MLHLRSALFNVSAIFQIYADSNSLGNILSPSNLHSNTAAHARLSVWVLPTIDTMNSYENQIPNGGHFEAPAIQLANQACLSCKKQKRKCDKALPACALCKFVGPSNPWRISC